MGLNNNLQIPHFDWVQNVLPADRIAYIGLRDVDEGERGILKKLNIRAYSMHEVSSPSLSHAGTADLRVCDAREPGEAATAAGEGFDCERSDSLVEHIFINNQLKNKIKQQSKL